MAMALPNRSRLPSKLPITKWQATSPIHSLASKNNTLVGSIAHGHASPTAIKNGFYDVITRHFNGQLDDAKATAAMVAAAKS